MDSGLIGSIILWLIVAIIAIVVVVYLLNWLYHRSTKGVAFVRTGFGGEKVVINGGALVLPIVHEVTPVNLNVVRIPVKCTQETALITQDHMRVDIEAEFFVKVLPKKESVSAAASTLGQRTMREGALDVLLIGKFIGALRSVAAELSLAEMHEQLSNLAGTVTNRAANDLAKNGLELESVAITNLDQTNLEYFNPANRFDAEGMTQLIETIESRRKMRNDIEQDAMLAIRSRNLASEKKTLEIEQESENSRLNQERELETMRAQQRSEITRIRAEKEAEAEKSRISNEQETREREIESRHSLEATEIKVREDLEKARIALEQSLEKERIGKEAVVRLQNVEQQRNVEFAEIEAREKVNRARIEAEEKTQNRDIEREQLVESSRANAQKVIETSRITKDQELDRARLDRDRDLRSQEISNRKTIEEAEISAREELERARIASDRGLDEAHILKERDLKRLEIQRAQALELAEIERQIALLVKQADEAIVQATTDTERAKAVEAEEKVVAVRETAIAERIAVVDRLLATKNADLARIAAETEKISTAVAAEAERLFNEADNVLSVDARSGRLRTKMLERLEGIVRESVRPLENIEGIKILHVDGFGNGGGNSNRSPTDEVIESALRYRAQAPLIDQMMKEIGVENPNVSGMGDIFRSAKDAQSIAKDKEGKGKTSDTKKEKDE